MEGTGASHIADLLDPLELPEDVMLSEPHTFEETLKGQKVYELKGQSLGYALYRER